MIEPLAEEIIQDIKQVAGKLGGESLSRTEYVQHGRFSLYQVYDGGKTWGKLCAAAGVKTKKIEPVPDEVYFQRLATVANELGRYPKTSERKKYQLNFSKRRFSTLAEFIDKATELGYVPDLRGSVLEESKPAVELPQGYEQEPDVSPIAEGSNSQVSRPVPPIPRHTNRNRWERTGIDGFPYAPQDESGVVAIFSILCTSRKIDWQVLELRSGRGTDATCYDHQQNKEVRVELKYTHSKANWNHSIDEVDYVVCWENRWQDFPKPVIVLRDLLKTP